MHLVFAINQHSKIGKGESPRQTLKTYQIADCFLSEFCCHVVMKKIAALDNIARNDELKITERASQMMQKVSSAVFISRFETLAQLRSVAPQWHAQVEQPRSE